MGMYDTLGNCSDNQVKLFTEPVYYGKLGDGRYGLGFMGGRLLCFKEGDEVPYKTWWYDYGKNFVILDVDNWGYDNHILHIIKDGKYIKTLSYGDFQKMEKDVVGINRCYDVYGKELLVKVNYEGISGLLNDYKVYSKEIEKLGQEETKALHKMIHNDISNDTSRGVYLDLIKESDEKSANLYSKYIQKYGFKRNNKEFEIVGGYLRCIMKRVKSAKVEDAKKLFEKLNLYIKETGVDISKYFEWVRQESNDSMLFSILE